jgi:predicted metalloendopeptidase
MGLFSRRDTESSETHAGQAGGHQLAMLEITDAFSEHDVTALAGLTPSERAEQMRIRQGLYDYIDAIWEAPKTAVFHPADDPRFDAVAALRDLAGSLVASVDQAQAEAGDDTED